MRETVVNDLVYWFSGCWFTAPPPEKERSGWRGELARGGFGWRGYVVVKTFQVSETWKVSIRAVSPIPSVCATAPEKGDHDEKRRGEEFLPKP